LLATLTIVDNGKSIPSVFVTGNFLRDSAITFLLLIFDSIVKTSVENKVKQSDINKIVAWVGNKNVESNYKDIDTLFSSDVLTIESKIKSRKVIAESLKKLPITKTEGIDLPLSTMVSVANKTIKSYIDGLNESDKKELIALLSEDDSELNEKYITLKEGVVTKLTEMKNASTDTSMQTRIDETISKVISEKYDKLTYFKLKNLKENL